MPGAEPNLSEQLTKYLTDVHSIEEQALTQLRVAPKIAGEGLSEIYARHLDETEEQEAQVREALEARGAEPSKVKDLAGKIGGWGMLAFAGSQPDTPGKLAAHAYSYEHMEIAAYELLARIAREAGDDEVVELARSIEPQERRMAERLEKSFDQVVAASLSEVSDREIETHLEHYLADAHALEEQALQVLSAAPKMLDDEPLSSLFEGHLEQTREHEKTMRELLEARGAKPSKVKDAALRVGGLNVGGFLAAQPDTPLKLVGFAYAFEHIEAAAYELLSRVAERAADNRAAAAARSILSEERDQGRRVEEHFDRAVAAGLEAHGIHT